MKNLYLFQTLHRFATRFSLIIILLFIAAMGCRGLAQTKKAGPNLMNSRIIAGSGQELFPGQTQSFSLTVANSGGAKATQVRVRAAVDARLQILSVTGGNDDPSSSSINWLVGDLVPNQTVTVSFMARLKAGDTNNSEVTVKMFVSSGEVGELCPGSTTLRVKKFPTDTEPKIVAFQTVNPPTALPGDKVQFHVIIHNEGTIPVKDVTVNETLPPGLELLTDMIHPHLSNFSTSSQPKLTYNESLGVVQIKMANLMPHEWMALMFDTRMRPQVGNGEVLTARALVQCQSPKITTLSSIKVQVGSMEAVSQSNQPAALPQPAAGTAAVDIRDNFFSPATLTVPPGTVITWTHKGGIPHTVTGDTCNTTNFSSDSQFQGGLIGGNSFSFTVPSDAAAGSTLYYHCRFHGGAGNCKSAGFGMAGSIVVMPTQAPDFTLSVSPDSQTVSAGSAAQYSVKVEGTGGFNKSVNLSVAVNPTEASLTPTFANASLSPGQTTQLSVASTAATPAQTYKLTVTGVSDQITHNSNVALTTTAPSNPGDDFSLALNPDTITLSRGKKGQISVNINRSGNFTGNVTVTPADTKSIKIKLKPPSVSTGGNTADFTCKIKNAAALGSQKVVFTGQDASGRVRTATLTVVIQN